MEQSAFVHQKSDRLVSGLSIVGEKVRPASRRPEDSHSRRVRNGLVIRVVVGPPTCFTYVFRTAQVGIFRIIYTLYIHYFIYK